MDWDELKKIIDDDIERHGFDGSIEVSYIEVSAMTSLCNGVTVIIDDDGLTVC